MPSETRTMRRTRAVSLTAVWKRALSRAVVAAVLTHAIVIVFWAAPPASLDLGGSGRALDIVVLPPPETHIPPAPEELSRPATPVLAVGVVDEEITIASTEIVEDQIVLEAPTTEPPVPGPVVAEDEAPRYSFTPYTIKPRCKTNCTGEDVVRYVPPLVQRMGVSCTMRVGIQIDTMGRVVATDLLEGSGNPICDQAILEWARGTEWTTAYNRDQAVVVWIAQPVTVQVAVAD